MNIYVANLSYQVNSEDLNELFAEYGVVTSAKVISDKFTGRSKGFGFVEMSDDSEGNKAISELNGAEYDGKVISVNIARPKPDYGNNQRKDYGGGNSRGYSKRY